MRLAAKHQTLQNKKPQQLLNDIIEGVRFSSSRRLSDGKFECVAKIEGVCFAGESSNEETAKLECIKTILRRVFDIHYDKPQCISEPSTHQIHNGGFDISLIEKLNLDSK